MGVFLAAAVVVGGVLGRFIGPWALVVPAGVTVWIGTHADLEGDVSWVVGGAFGVSAALGVIAGVYARRGRRSAPSSQRD
jgi:hypothetical protein